MTADPLSEPEEAIRRLYGYVSYRIGSGADAEDVVSATIERALTYRNSYDPGKGSPAAWLAGIANRCLSDHANGRLGRTGLGTMRRWATRTSSPWQLRYVSTSEARSMLSTIGGVSLSPCAMAPT